MTLAVDGAVEQSLELRKPANQRLNLWQQNKNLYFPGHYSVYVRLQIVESPTVSIFGYSQVQLTTADLVPHWTRKWKSKTLNAPYLNVDSIFTQKLTKPLFEYLNRTCSIHVSPSSRVLYRACPYNMDHILWAT